MEINYKFINSLAKNILDSKELIMFRKSLEPFCNYLISLFYSAGYNPLIDHVPADNIDKIIRDFFSFYSPEIYENILNIQSFDIDSLIYISKSGEQENLDYLIKRLKKLREAGKISKKAYHDLENYHRSEFEVKTEESGITPDGKVKIVMTGTTEDIFIRIHEMTHKVFWQSVDANDRKIAHEYLIEVNSIILELLLHDYLIQNDVHVEDADRYKTNRFTSTLEMAYLFKFESLLLEILENEGEITSLNIDQYISKCGNEERQEFREYKLTFLQMIEKSGFQMIMSGRYIFGLFAACYIKKKIDDNKENSNLIYKIGKNIYESDVEEALKKCGLDFFTISDGEMEFDIEKLNEIGDALTNELVSLQERVRK